MSYGEPRLRELCTTALRMAGRWNVAREDAEEIAQDAMVRLLFHGRRVSNPEAYLAVVVRRLARELRERDRHRRCAEESCPRSPATRGPDPGLDLERLIMAQPPSVRRLLMLMAAGFSHREIGAALGCPTGSVGTMLARAQSRLRRSARLLPLPRTRG